MLCQRSANEVARSPVCITALASPGQEKWEDMKHALDLQDLMRDAVRLELFRQQPYRIAEDLVAPVHEKGRRPATQIVEQYVHTLVVRIDAVQI